METSLSIELTEPVVALQNDNTLERISHHQNDEMSPPAIVRGLLTLKLAKPTKISGIELELQAKATTRYVQGAGPSRLDVTEQYNVHSASTVVFKAAGPAPQAQARSASARPRPRVQFSDEYAGSRALHRAENGRWHAPSPDFHPVSRSTSLDPGSLRVTQSRSLWTGDMDMDMSNGSYQQIQVSSDPAPPYPGSADQPSLNAETCLSVADRSQSIASSSRSTGSHSSPVRSRSRVTPDMPHRSPASSVLSLRGYTLSRTSSIEESPELEDDSESFDHASALPHDNIAYYGLSRIPTASSARSSEQDHRGRSRSRFSLGNIVHVFDAVKDRVRSRSPGSLPRPEEQEQRGRSLVKGKGKPRISTYGMTHQIGVAEPPVADGANNQSGDGWVVFPQGTYTYPILFTIPNNSPPTSKAHHGSLTWKIKANVKRPGVFTTKLTTQKEVIVVSLPKHSEEEGIDLQRPWEDQFQYRVQIAGRAFPIGGKVPFQLTISPMAKIKVHSISVYLDERTDYYSRAQSQVRSDVIRRATLLAIKQNNSDEQYSVPILPLTSGEPDAFRKSPLHRFVGPEENENDVASSFMGPGPWTIRHHLRIPDSCSVLHPSNRAKGSNVMVDHSLKIILRVEKEAEAVTAGRKKVYDIIIHTPVQILSCRCTTDWTSLPRYDEALQSGGDSAGDISACPCRARNQASPRTRLPAAHALERVASRGTTHSGASEAQDMWPSDSLAGRTHLYEQLISGLVSETGEAPPSYEYLGITSV